MLATQAQMLNITKKKEELEISTIILLEPGEKPVGECFQVVNQLCPYGRVIWNIDSRIVDLRRTRKCLGGLSIGQLKQADMPAFKEVPAMPQSAGWNCRDWVVQAIAIMMNEGWVRLRITDGPGCHSGTNENG
ncbi:hypothetical protein BXZ70DRAFT_911266 [Cristinia sonorae]|uniref:Uncharacterized protein n=1 Tax=Cristinia sonorae TaxID=1940300 RepID=A0A8K0XK55_9AGAR|nr:hypothetical protein BXZ70DRAFT_911266 [Cristinia sonorae]